MLKIISNRKANYIKALFSLTTLSATAFIPERSEGSTAVAEL